MLLDFGREVCGDLATATRREWLVTNGIGGFASGTIANMLTRRYHGLLMAALQPPLGRTLLLAKLDETAEYDGRLYPLYTNRWEDGTIEGNGHVNLDRFHLEGTTPVWTFAMADALLEKRIWMQQGANTTYIQYRLARAAAPLALSIKALVNDRDYHATTIMNDWVPQIEPTTIAGGSGLRLTAFDGATTFYLTSDRAEVASRFEWYEDFYLSVEEARGQRDVIEDHIYAARLQATLREGESFVVVASTEAAPDLDGAAALAARRAHERGLLERASGAINKKARRGTSRELPPSLSRLLLAADQFIVDRPSADNPDGKSIIAGYHWFSDWGRDTMIALPGLTLATGRPEVAAEVLRTYARYVDRGMLPNRFPDVGETPEYNTVDATLWYFIAARETVRATGDMALLRDLYPVLADIIAWHRRGTRYNIHMDQADALLHAGEAGVQLTWMDVKIDDWVVTPRTGKPVEINALWYNALSIMEEFAGQLGEDATEYAELAERVRRGFGRFWNADLGYCYDVVDGPLAGDGAGGDDPSLRPNQLLAVSLPHSPLTTEQQRAVVDICGRRLLTAHGLRSLSPDDPAYIGTYGGSRTQRDSAYHQGTVWAWLIGPFVAAHLRVHGDAARARAFLEPLLQSLVDHGVGSISEIFEGDAPFAPRGCIAQAWSVAEVLRVWRMTETEDSQ